MGGHPGRPGAALLGLVLTAVDGDPRPITALGELSATHHRLHFDFAGLNLAASDEPLEYKYHLLGLSDAWSWPGTSPEAQFLSCQNGQLIWDFRDGTVIQCRTAQHVFRRPGTCSVRFSMRGYGFNACVASHCMLREVVVEL